MRPKLNLKDKSQMSTPNEYTDNLKSNLICIFLSVRTKSKKPLCPRTQCSKNQFLKNLCRGNQHRGFQFLLILDLWGVSFHAAVVFGLGKDFFFESTL